jgi:hypothetical protein
MMDMIRVTCDLRTCCAIVGRSSGTLIESLVMPVASVIEPPVPIFLFSLHLLVDEPKGVNMSGEISQYSQTYVNEQVTATASNESGSRWWKDDGNKNQKDVRGFDHTGGTQVRGYADAVSNWG